MIAAALVLPIAIGPVAAAQSHDAARDAMMASDEPFIEHPRGREEEAEVESWTITREDYSEFCAGSTSTIDLRERRIVARIGGCIPNRSAPPRIVEAELPPALADVLRAATAQPSAAQFTDPDCDSPGTSAWIFPGPTSWMIEKGEHRVKFIPSPCVTPAAEALANDVAKALRLLNEPQLR